MTDSIHIVETKEIALKKSIHAYCSIHCTTCGRGLALESKVQGTKRNKVIRPLMVFAGQNIDDCERDAAIAARASGWYVDAFQTTCAECKRKSEID